MEREEGNLNMKLVMKFIKNHLDDVIAYAKEQENIRLLRRAEAVTGSLIMYYDYLLRLSRRNNTWAESWLERV